MSEEFVHAFVSGFAVCFGLTSTISFDSFEELSVLDSDIKISFYATSE